VKKRLLFILLGVVLLVIDAPVVYSAALIIKDNICWVQASDSGLPVGLTTYDSHTVRSSRGNVTLSCHFEIPEEYIPAETIITRGFNCCIGLDDNSSVCTENSMTVASDDGDALLKCKFKKRLLDSIHR
jgi:hypothetical protein